MEKYVFFILYNEHEEILPVGGKAVRVESNAVFDKADAWLVDELKL